MGEEGLEILAEIRREFGLLIVTETIDPENCDLVEKYADVLQVGARNMQNFSLLKRVGRSKLPVLLKRGMSATLDEFLMAAEYILSEGNYNVILCERGVRTFADHSRNTLDLSVIPAVKRLSHLPIIVDPSHGTGKRDNVIPLARAAVAVGADGLIVEVHPDPDHAISDGYQSLFPSSLKTLMEQVTAIAGVLGRTITGDEWFANKPWGQAQVKAKVGGRSGRAREGFCDPTCLGILPTLAYLCARLLACLPCLPAPAPLKPYIAYVVNHQAPRWRR